ncbi:MAG: hypothetical protein ACOX52_21750 [Verrucomicrobiota bacterium]
MDRSNSAAELCQNRNNTVAAPGFSCPNPSTSPFDTETDSDPDPDLASPWTLSDSPLTRPKIVHEHSEAVHVHVHDEAASTSTSTSTSRSTSRRRGTVREDEAC